MEATVIGLEVLLDHDDIGANITEKDNCKVCYSYAINDLANQKNKIRFERLYKELRRLQLFPPAVSEDLFLVACAVYAADIRINRYEHAQDSWTRKIKLFVPVSNPDTWQNVLTTLVSILEFLTGDIWELSFRKRPNRNLFSTSKRKNYCGMPYATNTVCLFSGGMDSFIGAFDLLNKGTTPLLVGHSKSADVSYFRNSAFKELEKKFSGKNLTLVKAYVNVDKQKGTSREDSERGRSFLFLTLGILCASSLPVKDGRLRKLIVPENGMISLNIALTPLRLGAYSTRTTHPHVLKLMQKLVNELDLRMEIFNPYQLKTKGEMLKETGAANFIAESDTMSCSRPATRNAHVEGKGLKHCGRCVPCIIRRAALKRAGILDAQSSLPTERQYRIDIINQPVRASKVNGENVMAFKYLINRIEKHPSYLTAMIRLTGPVDDVDSFIKMYKRGVEEVKAVIDTAKVIA